MCPSDTSIKGIQHSAPSAKMKCSVGTAWKKCIFTEIIPSYCKGEWECVQAFIHCSFKFKWQHSYIWENVLFLQQMSSKHFWWGCRRISSSTPRWSNICGRWMVYFSGAMSSWKAAWKVSSSEPSEWFTSSSASARGAKSSPTSTYRVKGEHNRLIISSLLWW